LAEQIQPSHEYVAEDLPQLLKELDELKEKFDTAAVNKHKLQNELHGCIHRLDMATIIIQK
jgi:hypothetical protein